MTTEERFWCKVVHTDNGCWEWTGSITPKGYGMFRYNGKTQTAHRVSWQINRGEIPYGADVLHICDNRKCINPDHLWLGTDQDNMDDMYNKGRDWHLSREKHPMAKLTVEEVDAIRSIYSNGDATQRQLAKEFGVHQGTIFYIVNNKHWKEQGDLE
jgi:hypothetical protein